jgi:hypothetical protein
LIGYARAPLLRRFRLQRSPWYWRWRQHAATSQFRIRRRAFAAKSGFSELRQKGAVFSEILVSVVLKLGLSVLVVAALVLIEWEFPRLAATPWWKLTPEAEYSFLGTLAQISATMLGLYFAAVSLVASTAYARVPGDVRAMIVEEQVGNFYFAFLAQFAATAVVMLAAASLGVPLGAVNILWISFLSLFGLFSFVVLGLRTFSFFDPTALVQHLNHRLARAIAEVTPAGFKWLDPSFQSHHERQAERIVEVYANLVTMAEQGDDLNSRALVELAEGLFSALNHHAWAKARVPSKSFWFRRRPKHKHWLVASYHELEVARATDTSLQPEMVPDLHWFESEVGKVLARIVNRLANRADRSGLVSVLNAGQKHGNTAALCGGAEEALLLQRVLGRELDRAFAHAKFDGTTEETVAQSLNRIAAVDLHALALINVLLGTARALEAVGRPAFEDKIGEIDWPKPASLYLGHFPREVLKQLEEMREWLDFERQVEGEVVTPEWLQVEVAALGYARFLSSVLERLLLEFEIRFGQLAEQRVKAGDHIGAASLINRGLEATNKLEAHLPGLRTWWEALLKLNRSRDWEWPAIDWVAAEARSVALRDRLVKQLAACIGPLIKLPEEKMVPDLFGQAYSVLADNCFDALLRGDDAIFSAIFPAYFATALEAHHKVRGTLGKIDNRNIGATLGPLSDLLAISGFAELYSALTGKPFAAVCRGVWDGYMAGYKDDDQRRAAIGMFSLTKEPLLGMSSREMLRFRWERATRDYLQGQGIATGDYGYGFRRRGSPLHASPLVRAFAFRGDLLNDAEDVFLALYLFRRPEAAGLEIPDEVDSFQQAVAREESEKEDADGPS